MKKSKTKRGFALYTFKDRYGDPCSLQKSSNADFDAVWLGLSNTYPEVDHVTGKSLGMRMLIDKKLAKQLVKKLTQLIETGEI